MTLQELENVMKDFETIDVSKVYTPEVRQLLNAEFQSGNWVKVMKAINIAHIFIAKEVEGALDDFVSDGIIGLCIEKMDSEEIPLQSTATLTLSSIAKNEYYAKQIVAEGAVPKLLKLTLSNDVELTTPAFKALHSIIADKPELREALLKDGIIQHLHDIIGNPETSEEILQEVAWVFLGICFGKVEPLPQKTLNTFLPTLKKFLASENDMIAGTAAATFQELSEVDYKYDYIDEELIKMMVKQLDKPITKTHAIKFIKNVNFGNVPTWAYKHGIMNYMPDLIGFDTVSGINQCSKESLINATSEDAVIVLAKLIDDSWPRIQDIFDFKLVPLLLNKLDNKASKLAENNALFIFYKTVLEGSEKHCKALVKEGFTCKICGIWQKTEGVQENSKILSMIRQIVEEMFKKLEAKGAFFKELGQCGCGEMAEIIISEMVKDKNAEEFLKKHKIEL